MPDPTDPGFTSAMPVEQPADGHGGRCGATTKQTGAPCTQPAGWGTSHPGIGRCKLHGGSTPSHEVAAKEAQARADAMRLGIPVPTTGTAALQDALARAYGDVLAMAAKVQLLPDEELTQVDGQGKFQRPSVWVELYQQSLQHYAVVADRCVARGIEAAAVSVVQAHGEQVISLLRRVLGRLGHDLSEPTVVEVVTAELQALDVGGGEAA